MTVMENQINQNQQTPQPQYQQTVRNKILLIGVAIILVVSFSYKLFPNINQSQTNTNPTNTIVPFAVSVFNSIKSNDFNSFVALLPSAPFTLNLSSLEHKKENITITAEAFVQMRTNYQIQFNSIISALNVEGLTLSDIDLHKIIAEFDGGDNFQVVEVYLILNTIKGRYRIRIEDCFKIEDKYLPGQLKWYGQKEYTR